MPLFNGDIEFLDASGQVIARSGDLTLRADSTGVRDIIVGSGAALRPERDNFTDLGRDSHRWREAHVGRILATSGIIGDYPAGPYVEFAPPEFPSNTWLNLQGGTILLTNNQIDGSSVSFNLAAGSDMYIDEFEAGQATLGNTFFTSVNTGPLFDLGAPLGSQETRFRDIHASSGVFNYLSPPASGGEMRVFGHLYPENPSAFALGSASRKWSQIIAVSGVLDTLVVGGAASVLGNFATVGIATLGGGAFIGVAGAPVTDATLPLGVPSLRWERVQAVSGILETISPRTSGTFVTMNGSWIPDRDALRGLGTSVRRWASLRVVSGIFSIVSASTVGATDVNIDSSLTFSGDGAQINQAGQLTWDANGAEIVFSNLGFMDLNGSDIVNVGTLDGDTVTVNTVAATSLSATNASFTNRPTIAGSGVLMQRENYFEVFGGTALQFGATSGTTQLLTGSNNLVDFDHGFVIGEAVQIRRIAMQVTHLNASQPNPWAIRMRLNDNTNDHASGLFTWHPISGALGRYIGSMSGTQTIPRGSRVKLLIDSNGNPAHDTTFVKAWLGFTVVSGLQ